MCTVQPVMVLPRLIKISIMLVRFMLSQRLGNTLMWAHRNNIQAGRARDGLHSGLDLSPLSRPPGRLLSADILHACSKQISLTSIIPRRHESHSSKCSPEWKWVGDGWNVPIHCLIIAMNSGCNCLNSSYFHQTWGMSVSSWYHLPQYIFTNLQIQKF